MQRRALLSATGCLFFAGLAGCAGAPRESDGGDTGQQSGSGVTINNARDIVGRYADPEAAREDGFERAGGCVAGLGVPFVDRTREDETFVDSTRPTVLFYDDRGAGLDLVGAEWFVPAETVGVDEEPPKVFAGSSSEQLAGPMAGHVPGQPRHYGLHAWLWAENPNGLFARTHPDVGCQE